MGRSFYPLETAGRTLKPTNVKLGPNQVKYLGHARSPEGVRIGEDRIKAIVDLATPETTKGLRSVLDTVNFERNLCRA